MLGVTQRSLWPLSLCGLLACLIAPGVAHAQEDPSNSTAANSEFTVNDSNTGFDNNIASDNRVDTNAGPVRLARFAYVSGNVSWRPAADSEWSKGSINLPLRQGAQVWVTDGGRAEIQFDDGAVLRLGNGAVITLQTLYSDAQGEFTEIKMTGGVSMLRARNAQSVYQIDTPVVSIKVSGRARVRVGAGNGAEVAVRSGEATVEGPQGKTQVRSGQYLDAQDATTPFDLSPLPGADSWDRWNDSRDERIDALADGESKRHLPANIDIVAGDLDAYGSWRDDAQYGSVWCPRDVGAGWRPYHDGHWTWVTPFGWTWVSDESWGWAPYHYGTWVCQPYGWAWCPGPVNQYWCPGVVHFSQYEGRIGWCPLAPSEVRYPSYLSIGFGSGPWFASFSIGACGVYYPEQDRYCVGRSWGNSYINHVRYENNTTIVNNRFGPINENFNHHRFQPVNAQSGGGSVTSVNGFGGHGNYGALPPSEKGFFSHGNAPGAPPVGSVPASGPVGLRPTSVGLTPNRSFLPPNTASPVGLSRPVFRMPLPSGVARNTQPITSQAGQHPSQAPGIFRTPNSTSSRGPEPFRPQAPITRTGTGEPNRIGTGNRSGSEGLPTTRSGGYTPTNDRRPIDNTSGTVRGPIGSQGGLSPADAANRARASLGLPGTRTAPYGGNTGGATGVPGNSGYERRPGGPTSSGQDRRSSEYTQSRPQYGNSPGRVDRSTDRPYAPVRGSSSYPGQSYGYRNYPTYPRSNASDGGGPRSYQSNGGAPTRSYGGGGSNGGGYSSRGTETHSAPPVRSSDSGTRPVPQTHSSDNGSRSAPPGHSSDSGNRSTDSSGRPGGGHGR